MGDLEERVARLSPEKRQLLKLQLQRSQPDKARGSRPSTGGIPCRDKKERPDPLPLSFAQQRLWFLSQWEPDSSLYNIPAALHLRGRLDVSALEKTLNEIVRRHEALRTTFTTRDGRPAQVVAPTLEIPLPVVDLRHLPEGEHGSEALRLATEEARQPFDLARGPLFRARLLWLEEDEHVLLLTIHHIVSDGWSMGVLVKEMSALYEALAVGRPSPLDELPIQYADYALWQREWLQGENLENQLAYWKARLAGQEPFLDLPTDHPRPVVQASRGSAQSFYLPERLMRQLTALSQREGVTLFMTLLAAFQTLLSRYSLQAGTPAQDISVGIPVANRHHTELEPLVGFFVNTLVMRTDLRGDPTFRELLQRVRETVLGGMAHQDLPFEMLVEALQPQRDTSYTPLFQVMFDLQNAVQGGLADTLRLSSLAIMLLEVDRGTSKFDLSLSLEERRDGLKGTWEYNTDLFERQTILRMIGHLGVLLEGIVADPDQHISRLPILTEAERQQLLVRWNDTARHAWPDRLADGAELCIHHWVERQVERTPEATALTWVSEEGTRSLTYRELDRRANCLAHYLRKRGVGPDVLVGLCVERSLELIIGILGVLKAGGAYVPLDPAYPQDRLAFMLRDITPVACDITPVACDITPVAPDSAGAVLLTQGELVGRLPPYEGEVICLDRDWESIAQASDSLAQDGSQAPESGVGPDNLAYVIYTSGSTGKPKGTLLHHRGLCNVVQAFLDVLEPRPGERMLQFFSPSFDGSLGEIFSALVTGGTVFLARRDVLSSPPDLWRLFRDQAINMALMAPAMWGALPADELPALRVGCSGGEALPSEVAARWATGRRFVNIYGPTETTVIVATYVVEGALASQGSVPIGRPVLNTTMYLLDAHGQPVPIGVPGELHIGGIQVARGYLNRPDLTEEKFIPDPFSSARGARLYRSGDLARYLPDGNIEFLGRIDQQVKIRGFRIELGEIEAVLEQHAGVQQAVAMAREDVPGQKRLVAYVVTQANGDAPSVSTLQGYLQEKLPTYMVPSALVFLDSIPLTPNGKVDRRALPVPEWDRSGDAQAYIPPRNAVEQAICQIWEEVLAAPQVGIGDNFFEIGGHSLLATQVVSRVRQVLGIDIPLRALFESPTVEKLAERVDSILRANKGSTMPSIEAISREGLASLPLSFAQQRLWFLDQLEPNTPLYNVPTAVRLSGQLDVAALEDSVNEIIRRHETLRTTFATAGGRAQQVIGPAWRISLAVQDLTELPEEAREREVLRLADEEAQRPFDLAQGPLLRMRLLSLGTEEHIVLLTMHHIISDGWSLGVLVHELAQIYGPTSRGEEVRLAPLRIQYADYAEWQRQWLQGDVLDRQLAYWKEQLKGLPPLLEMPTDHPRPALQGWRGHHQVFALSTEVTQGLKDLSQREGVTLFMTLLAAFQTLLYRYSGQTDISVGTPIANRIHADLEQLIGFFVNTLVLRTQMDGTMSFRALLQRVREAALGAYAHQDVPFEMLVDVLQPQRDTSHTPLFQVMFALQNAGLQGPAMRMELSGLTMEPLDIDAKVAPFDLTLTLYEQDGTLQGNLEYNTDLYEAATIRRMIGHLQTMLQNCIKEPQCEIETLPLLSDEEREQVLVGWNDTACEYPAREYSRGLCMHHLFELSAARNPETIAVVTGEGTRVGDQRLTYAELNARANYLAHYLRRVGVGPDVLVGLCLERSLDMAVALLGILKAGGAYVPLDPAFPAERLTYMMQDSGAPIILTQEHLMDRLPASGAQVVLLDAEWPRIAQEAESHHGCWSENPASGATPDNLAYVIYTSGSTGQPKGVMVVHRGVVNHNLAAAEVFGLDPDDRVLQFSTINFDAAVEEFFPAWWVGATVVLRPEGPLTGGEELLDLIERERLTVLDLPTAYWHEWVYELSLLQRPLPASLRLVVVGGDKASPEHLATWQRMAGPGVTWLNTYGPTEGTIIASTYGLKGQDPAPTPLPIGRPLPNVRLYILDKRGQPTPVGVPGELFIAGAGVARGYLNRPELTAERFVPDPWGNGERMYRTGDLARFQHDGNIEFLGRNDEQVKVRGFRIELGEIEAALKQAQGVRDAVVLVREEADATKRLVACVVPAELPSPSSGAHDAGNASTDSDFTALRSLLLSDMRAKLPEYMIPSALVFLDAWPLTATGKVDRRALSAKLSSAPEAGPAATRDAYVAPRTEQERVLAAIWAEVLRQERVGVHDNFFELGGDSILSIQVIARANQAGLSLSPRQLFQSPTIAGLAALAAKAPTVAAEQGLVQGSVPLTPIQRWFFEQDFAEAHHWNQAVLLRVQGRLRPDLLSDVMAALLQQHDALRLRFRGESTRQDAQGWEQWNDGYEEVVPIPWRDLAGLSLEEQEAVIEREASVVQASLDLGEGPLFGMAYWDLGDGRGGRLLLVAHHLVIDGISWRILLEDLQTAYGQLREGHEVHLPAKTTSFREWAQRLVLYAQSEAAGREAFYWRGVASKEMPTLPVDMDGENTEDSARSVAVSLGEDETHDLLQRVPAVYADNPANRVEINELLLAALQQCFAWWMGERDLLIGLEGHGREDILAVQKAAAVQQAAPTDISRTVGWFTTLYPVRFSLRNVSNPAAALKAAKEQLRRVPNKGFGYGVLRYLSEDAQLRQALSIEDAPVSFNYLGQFDQLPRQSGQASDDEGGLSLAPESIGPSHSLRAHRTHLIEVSGMVVEKRLRIEWSYSENIHQRQTIEALAQAYLDSLRALIDHCLTQGQSAWASAQASTEAEPGAPEYVDADVSHLDMEAILSELDETPAGTDTTAGDE